MRACGSEIGGLGSSHIVCVCVCACVCNFVLVCVTNKYVNFFWQLHRRSGLPIDILVKQQQQHQP